MNHKFEFSVIIACYNPDFEKLKKTINSTVNQQNVRFEIIITDDGSREKYETKVKDYFREIGFKNYKLNFLQENCGTVCNILSGVKLADADYIKTMSPGDYFYNENSLAEYLRSFKSKGADLIFSRAQYYTPQYELLSLSAPKNTIVFRNRYLKRNIVSYHDYVLGAAIAARSELYEYLTQFIGKIKYVEDVPLVFLSLLNQKKVYAVNQKLVWYEYGLGISTNPETSYRLNSDFDVFFDFLKENYKNELKLSLKFREIMQQQSRWKRLVKRVFVSPLYLFYVIRKKFSKNNFTKNEIEILKKITKLSDKDHDCT